GSDAVVLRRHPLVLPSAHRVPTASPRGAAPSRSLVLWVTERLLGGLAVRVVVGRVEFNRANVTEARSHAWDIDSALPQLISPGTHGIVRRINGLTGGQQGEMPIPRRAVIGKGV